MAKTETAFETICPGLSAAVEDGTVLLRINSDRTKGHPSSTGKMVITAGTPGGFFEVPGTSGFRINLSAGYKA